MDRKTLRRLVALALVVALAAPWASAAPWPPATSAGAWWVSWWEWLGSLWEKDATAGGGASAPGECLLGTCTNAGPLIDPWG